MSERQLNRCPNCDGQGWEPVLLYGGRLRDPQDVLRDWLVCNPRNADSFTGAKPYEFCAWLFRALGLEPGDELDDLFPGSGAVGRAWETFQSQLELVA